MRIHQFHFTDEFVSAISLFISAGQKKDGGNAPKKKVTRFDQSILEEYRFNKLSVDSVDDLEESAKAREIAQIRRDYKGKIYCPEYRLKLRSLDKLKSCSWRCVQGPEQKLHN